MSSFDELKRFENDLKASEELRKRMDETVQRIKDAGQMKSDGELVTAAAKELGYDIPVTVLEQAQAEAEALDPTELEAVSGGVEHKQSCKKDYACPSVINYAFSDEFDHDGWCLTGWHCYAATLHTETKDKDVSCWKDYSCFWLNN